ncbi:MAG TPA: GAF domain-containing protein, partial [Gaiellaceae bacterium]
MWEVAAPAAVLVVAAVAIALWTRATASAKVAAVVHDLSAGLGRPGEELAASLDPDEVTERVLTASAALPGADAALLILDGKAEAFGLTEQEAERAALATPPNGNLRSMEVVYRYRLDEVGESSRLPRAALVVPLRSGDRALGSLSAVTRAQPHEFPPETAEALEALALRAGPALANARRFAEASRLAELDSLTGLS